MPDAPLFDRAHLDRQTGGDAALARELLDLFRAQCARILAGLADASATAQDRADLAHTLKGSALGIGAARLAACAGETEDRLRAQSSAHVQVEALAASVRATLEAIARHP